MPKTMTVKQIISIFQKTSLTLVDSMSKADLTSRILEYFYQLIKSEITEKQFVEEVDLIRFSESIDEYSIENNSTNISHEFYIQHKKEINKNERKAVIFQEKFRIIDLEAFKSEVKDLIWYSPEFYNEELRTDIIRKQKAKCALCGKEIGGNNPHLHHIDYDKSNCRENNLIFLCARCHGKSNMNRDFWKNLLTEKKKEIEEVR